MKKAILTIGLFTIVLATTSFASPKISTATIADNTVITSIDGTGGQDAGGGKKVDFNGGIMKSAKSNLIAEIDGTGGQDAGGGKKID